MQFIASLVAQLVKIPPQCRKARFSPWVGKIPWRREWLPTPVFLPGEFHGQGSMKGYFFPWSRKELDMTERLTSSACQLCLNKAIYLKIKASLNFLFRFCALPRNNWTSTLCSRCPSFALQIPNLPSVLFSAWEIDLPGPNQRPSAPSGSDRVQSMVSPDRDWREGRDAWPRTRLSVSCGPFQKWPSLQDSLFPGSGLSSSFSSLLV